MKTLLKSITVFIISTLLLGVTFFMLPQAQARAQEPLKAKADVYAFEEECGTIIGQNTCWANNGPHIITQATTKWVIMCSAKEGVIKNTFLGQRNLPAVSTDSLEDNFGVDWVPQNLNYRHHYAGGGEGRYDNCSIAVCAYPDEGVIDPDLSNNCDTMAHPSLWWDAWDSGKSTQQFDKVQEALKNFTMGGGWHNLLLDSPRITSTVGLLSKYPISVKNISPLTATNVKLLVVGEDFSYSTSVVDIIPWEETSVEIPWEPTEVGTNEITVSTVFSKSEVDVSLPTTFSIIVMPEATISGLHFEATPPFTLGKGITAFQEIYLLKGRGYYTFTQQLDHEKKEFPLYIKEGEVITVGQVITPSSTNQIIWGRWELQSSDGTAVMSNDYVVPLNTFQPPPEPEPEQIDLAMKVISPSHQSVLPIGAVVTYSLKFTLSGLTIQTLPLTVSTHWVTERLTDTKNISSGVGQIEIVSSTLPVTLGWVVNIPEFYIQGQNGVHNLIITWTPEGGVDRLITDTWYILYDSRGNQVVDVDQYDNSSTIQICLMATLEPTCGGRFEEESSSQANPIYLPIVIK